jgi:hypothetical protein
MSLRISSQRMPNRKPWDQRTLCPRYLLFERWPFVVTRVSRISYRFPLTVYWRHHSECLRRRWCWELRVSDGVLENAESCGQSCTPRSFATWQPSNDYKRVAACRHSHRCCVTRKAEPIGPSNDCILVSPTYDPNPSLGSLVYCNAIAMYIGQRSRPEKRFVM